MIISFPTGLYSTLLPTSPSDSRSVTFGLSGQPPRASQSAPQLPRTIGGRLHDPRANVPAVRRAALGNLIASSSRGGATATASGGKQYSNGQILEFAQRGLGGPALLPMAVAVATTIQHDTNVLDLVALGLTPADSDVLLSSAMSTFAALRDKLNSLRGLRQDLETALTDAGKRLGEINKTAAAVAVATSAAGDPATVASLQGITAKLGAQALITQATISDLTVRANIAASLAAQTSDQLNQTALMLN